MSLLHVGKYVNEVGASVAIATADGAVAFFCAKTVKT